MSPEPIRCNAPSTECMLYLVVLYVQEHRTYTNASIRSQNKKETCETDGQNEMMPGIVCNAEEFLSGAAPAKDYARGNFKLEQRRAY